MILLDASKRLLARGFFNQSSCADAETNRDMQFMREAIAAEEAREADARDPGDASVRLSDTQSTTKAPANSSSSPKTPSASSSTPTNGPPSAAPSTA